MHKKVYIVEEGYGKEKTFLYVSAAYSPSPLKLQEKQIPILMS